MGDATGYLSAIATDGEPSGFVREPNGDFSSGEFGPLGSMSTEDKTDASLVSLTTFAFFNSLGIGVEGRVVVIGWVAEDGVGRVSLLAHLDADAAALEPLSDLFMEEASPRILTIFAGLRGKRPSKAKQKIEKRKKMRVKRQTKCD